MPASEPATRPTAEQAAWRECEQLRAENEELKTANARLTEENDLLKREAKTVAWRLLRQAGVFDQEEQGP